MKISRRQLIQGTATTGIAFAASSLSRNRSYSTAVSATQGIMTTAALVDAVNNGVAGDEIQLGEATFRLTSPLILKAGMKLLGNTSSSTPTVITAASSWAPGFADLANNVDSEEQFTAYLIQIPTSTDGVTIKNIKFTAPALHGAIYLSSSANTLIDSCNFNDLGWSAIRTIKPKDLKVTRCRFTRAGKKPYGKAAGAIYGSYTVRCTIENSIFEDLNADGTGSATLNAIGFKTYGSSDTLINNCEFYLRSFAVEAPHNNTDPRNVVSNCIMSGAVSLPKYEGGNVTATNFQRSADGTFTWTGTPSWEIKECYWKTSYCVEGNRNSLHIHNCLMKSERTDVIGNMVSEFSEVVAQGPMVISDCYIEAKRGAVWKNGGMNNITITNNSIRTVADSTTDGFMGFPNGRTGLDMTTIKVKNNKFDSTAKAKALYRNTLSRQTVQTENNQLINVTDTAAYANTQTGAPIGPYKQENELHFTCGVDRAYKVTGWSVTTS